jgi:hypothetical protein
MNAYDELVAVIATGPGAERVARFRASDENQRRVAELLDREKNESLTPHEAAELDRYLQLEHLVRLAKARAHLYLQSCGASSGDRGDRE